MRQRRRMAGRRGLLLADFGVGFVVVAILSGALLTLTVRARVNRDRIRCLNNLHQLSLATMMFCNDNHGHYPAAARADGEVPADWVWWQSDRAKDVADGQDYRASGAVAKYMGRTFNAATFTCPSDDATTHPKPKPDKDGKIGDAYPYSYALNFLLDADVEAASPAGFDYLDKQVMRMPRVRHPAATVMYVEPDPATIDGGRAVLVSIDQDQRVTLGPDVVYTADRHPAGNPGNPNPPATAVDPDGDVKDPTACANVAFCDGHCAAADRAYVHAVKPGNWDPKR